MIVCSANQHAPTSTRSTGFCVIWVCISSSSSSSSGTKQNTFFVVIEFVASDSTAIDITCWKKYVAQRLPGCSMKAHHSGFVAKGGIDGLLLRDGLKEMTDLLKKTPGSR